MSRIRAESWLSASKLTPLEPARVSSQSIWATTGSEVRQPHVPRLRETSDRQLPVCAERAKCPRPGLPHRPHNPDCARANHIEHFCHWRYESPRRVRRLHFLGGWSHGRWFNEEVSACLTAASNLKSVGSRPRDFEASRENLQDV